MSDRSEGSEDDGLERHRALVRETDRRFATVYGAGGASVLVAGVAVLVIAAALGAIWTFLPWILSVTVVLMALFVLRSVVNHRREALRTQVHQYCELNGLDWQALRDYYESDGLYPYFSALFTERKTGA